MNIRSLFAILILLAVIVLALQSILQYTARQKLRQTIQKIEKQLDNASVELSYARSRMESMKKELNSLQAYMDSTGRKLEKMNQDHMSTSQQFLEERKLLKFRLSQLYLSLDNTSRALPEINIQE